ncbi:hypothetical protein SDC9_53044 [bioreactor metagenome]|uniref:LTD domain-containing protein n=1 Tax=bioreactor metagenome TaxID=1076179 RepID=A0A644WT79_9ZZZZ
MKKSILIIIIIASFLPAQFVRAQSQTDMRINEVMTINQNGPVDNFGHHVPWIEVYNSSYGIVNIAGMYLSDEAGKPKYRIPSDPVMVLKPQAYLLFYFDGNSEHGVLHTNFPLDSTGTIYLYSSNGKTIVDSVSFSFTYADEVRTRTIDGTGEWKNSKEYTPGQTNVTKVAVTNAELFVEYDPYGIGMALIAMTVVMSALAILYLVFKQLAKVFKPEFSVTKKSKKGHGDEDETVAQEEVKTGEMSGEINAAIAIALHLYREQAHDTEETVITLKKVSKHYSPWSSKLYNLRQQPNHIHQSPRKNK